MIEVISCGPLATMQDRGRPGWLGRGRARGGAADRLALDEAAALLGADPGAGIELPGASLKLRFDDAATVALTGAEMRAEAGRALRWHASHTLEAGAILTLRPSGAGVYSYIHVAGGIDAPETLASRSVHLIAGIGKALAPGDRFAVGSGSAPSRRLDRIPDRFNGGTLRLLPTPQTRLFPATDLARFQATEFIRDPRGNRQGVRLAFDGAGFATGGQLTLLSDFILPGDVQMTGDGIPYILGPECQTTGGYPRIGTVLAADLPRALQAGPGAPLRFRFVTLEEARADVSPMLRTVPLVRNPADMRDLGAMQLIGGVVSARGE
ncbi:MAG: urea amidolyase [Jannaschia sp.]